MWLEDHTELITTPDKNQAKKREKNAKNEHMIVAQVIEWWLVLINKRDVAHVNGIDRQSKNWINQSQLMLM